MVGLGSANLYNAEISIRTSDAIAALSIETLLGRENPFDLRGHRQKYHPGQYATAFNLGRLLNGSKIVLDEKEISEDLSGLLK
jgi:histidine ammonia-lyase|tara:strand:+ start:3781 stop:4029 length:249 start_codon:yes stop_codon:yes gene_type:complete